MRVKLGPTLPSIYLICTIFCLTPRPYSPDKLEEAKFSLWYYGVLTGPDVKLSSCITGQVIRWFSELTEMRSYLEQLVILSTAGSKL